MYDVVNKPSEVNQGASADTAKQHSSVSKAHAADIVNKVDKGDKSSADAKKRKEPAPEEVRKATEELNKTLDSLNIKRQFSVEDGSEDLVVRIIDTKEDEVIRQIPSEEAIRLSKNIREMVGVLYDKMS